MHRTSRLIARAAAAALIVVLACVAPAHADPEQPAQPLDPWAGLTYAVRDRAAAEQRWYVVVHDAHEAEQQASTRRSTRRDVTSSDGSRWDRVAECESGGDWSTNTGNGYYGGLQMDLPFWRQYATRVTVTHDDGSTTVELIAARPDLASRGEQIAAAERAAASRGMSPWPVCGRR